MGILMIISMGRAAALRFSHGCLRCWHLSLFVLCCALGVLPSAEAAIGRLGGDGGVSDSGAATYSIPIDVAAGMNGLKPDIALVYSSQSGDGLAGVGWTLSGFSKIYRCGRSNALDTLIGGVTYTAYDRFCLDGAPLIMTTASGTYGGDGVEYRTEVHTYQKVISHGTQGTGPASFEVKLANGLTYFFGNDTDSRIIAPGTSEVRVWALNTIQDKFSNKINYKYTSPTTGEYVPEEITWTSTGTGGPYKLQFTYQDLTSVLPSAVRSGYVWGSSWQATRRLQYIDYSFNDTPTHRYTLSYTASSTGKSQLQSVQQCNGGGSDCLPVTQFSWQSGGIGFGAETTTPPPSFTPDANWNERSVWGDFDGDGDTDLFLFQNGAWLLIKASANGTLDAPNPISLFTGTYNDGATVLEFNGDGCADLLANAGSGWTVYVSNCTGGIASTYALPAINSTVLPLDMNGDGLDDLVFASGRDVYIKDNLGGSFAAGRQSSSDVEDLSWTSRSRRQPADFDGDGREDLLGFRPVSGSTSFHLVAYRSNPSRDFSAGTAITTIPGQGRETVSGVDVNGDGLTDVVYFNGSTWRVHISVGGTVPYYQGAPAFLGDTCTDRVSSNYLQFAFVDYNSDGRADLVRTNGTSFRAQLSDGACYRNSDSNYFADIASVPADWASIVATDTNGDGFSDLWFQGSGYNSQWKVRLHNGPYPDLLTGVTDGLGNQFNPSYHALTNWAYSAGQGYTADGTATPPATRLIRGSPMQVVSQIDQSTGIGTGIYTTKYAYWNAKQDTTGRGFLGFATVKATDSRNDLVTETQYNQTFPYIGRPEKVTVWNGSNKVSESDPDWTKNSVGGVADSNHTAGQYHFVHLDQQVDSEYEVDAGGSYNGSLVRTVTRDTTFASPNDWDYTQGAPRRETVTVTPASGTTLTTTTDRTFATLTTAWCLGLPSTVAVNKSNGASNSTRDAAYTYYTTTCRPETETVGTTAAKQLKTTYVYDSAGRLLTQTQNAGDNSDTDRVMTVGYTDPGGFGFRPTSQTFSADSVDYAVGHSWNNALGLETGRTNPQGEATGWAHDDFGRLIAEVRPSSTGSGSGVSTFSYTAVSSAGWYGVNAKYKIREERTDGFWSESYRDAFGREVGKAFILNSGTTESRQAFIYNDLGQLYQETVPYRTGETAYSISHQYDLLGRPKSESRQVSEADTTTQSTNWVYNRLATTVTDAESHARIFTTDATGQLLSVQEPSPGGTTTYSYTPWGELYTVTDASGHVTTTISYDERGFRTGVVDQDAGSSTSEYTVWGELYRFRDARTGTSDWTLVNTYDPLGRLKNRVDFNPVTSTSATSTWTYYTSGAGKGLLAQARSYVGDTSSAIEYEETHAYSVVSGSQVSRSSTVTKITGAPQASYTTDYTYTSDGEGRLAHVTYPTTVSARPQFDYAYTRGYLDTVEQTEGSTYPRYDLVALDALGRETQVRLGGTALDVQTIYDRVNLLVKEIKSGAPVLGTGTQNLAYTWDKVGNLKSRQDLNQGSAPNYLSEVFTYDALNRLDTATLNGSTTQDLAYETDGNISQKVMPDNATYFYTYNTAGKPHAVSAAAYSSGCSSWVDNYTYDAAGNMLTRSGSSGNRYITWTAFSKPKQISVGSANCGGDCTTFTYGPDRQLVKQVDKKGGVTRSIYYIGPHFEVEVNGSLTQYRSHAFANDQVVFTQVEDSNNLYWQAYYPLRDHLGSVDKQYVAMGAGASPLVYSYDAFGRRRNDNWSNDAAGTKMAATPWNHQGYTGHEMLDTVQLVHMRGRVYDPTLGRFLSPDPLLDRLSMPQSLNAYSYVANNPLSYTDPSGLFLGKIGNFFKRLVRKHGRTMVAMAVTYGVASGVGAYMNSIGQATAQAVGQAASVAGVEVQAMMVQSSLAYSASTASVVSAVAGGVAGGAVATKSAKGAFWGGVTGGAFAGVNVAFDGQYSVGRVVADAAVGGGSAAAQGGEFKQGALFSGISSGAEYAYDEIVQWSDGLKHPSEWRRGKGSVLKGPNDKPIHGIKNIGTQGKAGFLTRLLGMQEKGGWFTYVANWIPGVNAVAAMHDTFQIPFEDGGLARGLINVPGMGVAAGITYPALMRGVPSVWCSIDEP
jgi:RHS repeat-associated protein